MIMGNILNVYNISFTVYSQQDVVSQGRGEGATLQQPWTRPQLKSHHQHEGQNNM